MARKPLQVRQVERPTRQSIAFLVQRGRVHYRAFYVASRWHVWRSNAHGTTGRTVKRGGVLFEAVIAACELHVERKVRKSW